MPPQTMTKPKELLNQSSYRPKKQKRKMKWENTLCLGLEWELDVISMNRIDYTRTEDLEKVDKLLRNCSRKLQTTNPFYYKYDCSVDKGVEFVTVPVTLQYIHNKMALYKVAEFINTQTSFRATDQCGIHVHLDKDFFTPLEISKLRIFFSVNIPYLSKFSKRKEKQLMDWSRFESGYRVKDFVNGYRKEDSITQSRRYACSFCTNVFDTKKKTPKTIELRLFASTTDPDRLVSILQFCDALAYFIKDHSSMTVSSKKCWKTFVDWCKKQNRYNHLVKELIRDNLAS